MNSSGDYGCRSDDVYKRNDRPSVEPAASITEAGIDEKGADDTAVLSMIEDDAMKNESIVEALASLVDRSRNPCGERIKPINGVVEEGGL